jgi:hypothetical protein
LDCARGLWSVAGALAFLAFDGQLTKDE